MNQDNLGSESIYSPIIKNRTVSFFAHFALLYGLSLIAMLLPVALYGKALGVTFWQAAQVFSTFETSFVMTVISVLIVHLGFRNESPHPNREYGGVYLVDYREIFLYTGIVVWPVILVLAPDSSVWRPLFMASDAYPPAIQCILFWGLHWLANSRYQGHWADRA